MVVGSVERLPWCGVLVPSLVTGLRDLLDGGRREAGESMGSPGTHTGTTVPSIMSQVSQRQDGLIAESLYLSVRGHPILSLRSATASIKSLNEVSYASQF